MKMQTSLRRGIQFLLLFSLLIPVLAQDSGLKADNNSSTEKEIQALETQLADLLVKGNWQAHASHLSDDYTETGAQVRTRQQVMADLQSGKIKFLYLTPDEMQVRAYGDAAILNMHLSVVERENGKVNTTVHRMTKVFVRRKDQWFVVALTDVPVSH
jgi:ketosteroid isomerase-like protein